MGDPISRPGRSAGSTTSADFPITSNAIQKTYSGNTDAFVTTLNSTGQRIPFYSTYLGGASTDQATSLAVDNALNVYVTGYTLSNNFPVTPGAFQTTTHGNNDAFISKLVIASDRARESSIRTIIFATA